MDNATKTEIIELMKELNTDKYSYSGSWKGYDVYMPEYSEIVYVGLPYVVLVKGDKVRLSTPEESMEYLEYSNPEFLSDNRLIK